MGEPIEVFGIKIIANDTVPRDEVWAVEESEGRTYPTPDGFRTVKNYRIAARFKLGSAERKAGEET